MDEDPGPDIPVSALDALRLSALDAGLSVDRLAGDLGLDVSPERSETGVPLTGFLRLQRRIFRLMGPDGSVLPQQSIASAIDIVKARLPETGTLQDALEIVADAINLVSGDKRVAVVQTRDALRLEASLLSIGSAPSDPGEVLFSNETNLLLLHALIQVTTQGTAERAWRGVELQRTSGPSTVPFERHVPVAYGSSLAALLYDPVFAKQESQFAPVPAVTLDRLTEEQLSILRSETKTADFSNKVRMLIERGAEDQSTIARRLGMSVATLRRRLTEEGASFRQIRSDALSVLADQFLGSEMPLAQVANRLGFSDTRSFSRAYKSWSGVTPNARRKALRA
ncbi:helix-turn-helix transcriptional regulator [Parvularcula sp. ZS-1/3]|uniref:Helix-turn-helix transcriptional regulator n=1 Tax=Parvularcula mediterranea TaxID=2732508 RepID=A0A7Y3RPW7_9PROT|nr:helix-turn-helix transcriptional regulator [Parvularcula mediterranea]